MDERMDAVVEAVRSTALASFELANSCVETTRLLILVLDRLGIKARPQAVNVRIYNMLGLEYAHSGIPMGEWPKDAWAIGTDPDPLRARENGWPGHLVAVIKDADGVRRLIDASADQFSRPQYGINVPGAVTTRIEGDWFPDSSQYRILRDGNTVIEYTPLSPVEPRGSEWRTFPAWVNDPEIFEETADQIAEVIRSKYPNEP